VGERIEKKKTGGGGGGEFPKPNLDGTSGVKIQKEPKNKKRKKKRGAKTKATT